MGIVTGLHEAFSKERIFFKEILKFLLIFKGYLLSVRDDDLAKWSFSGFLVGGILDLLLSFIFFHLAIIFLSGGLLSECISKNIIESPLRFDGLRRFNRFCFYFRLLECFFLRVHIYFLSDCLAEVETE